MVILPRTEYERLRKLAARAERDEDAGTRRIIRRERARIARGEDILIPQSYADRIAAGENAIVVVREWRGMRQHDLATQLGIGQGYLSDIEHGRRRGPARLMAQIARALAVPLDLLVD